ncbi:uncharacterized protein A4U43_C03F25140 [Asparagus officinalis]|uniref:HMA domain-containing protein n=1 Tax=Asparagus officinalis TaxID=4686 RepID=A0A5P1FH37_ASPOF|nr:heavy metal-associated isoprenylated plant protein 7-like [Asparagus officinalis]ONK76209.1 uncharacterized protein A4U43_C03F25140 [Asparagus officinalis]
MPHKVSTIILKVDLDCQRCYKKISETICKLEVRENIQTIEFDEKNNTVTISGRFDPKKLSKKLCCGASNVIKDIQIIEKKEKGEPKSDEPKDKIKETKKDDPKNGESKDGNLKDDPVKSEPVIESQEPELGCRPVRPSFGCNCACRPWYEGCCGKCCWCWRGNGCRRLNLSVHRLVEDMRVASSLLRRSLNLRALSCNLA